MFFTPQRIPTVVGETFFNSPKYLSLSLLVQMLKIVQGSAADRLFKDTLISLTLSPWDTKGKSEVKVTHE